MSNFLTTKQAAEILNVQPVAVSRAITRGKIQATKFGTQWMIAKSEIERYDKDRRTRTTTKK